MFLRLRNLVLLVCLAGLTPLTAIAQTPVHPPLDVYGDLPSTQHVALSPDGKTVAFVVRRDGQASVVSFELASKTPRVVGSIGDMKMGSLHFLNNETLIIKVSKTNDVYWVRGKYEASGAVAFNLKTGKLVPLLQKTKNLHPAQSGLGNIAGYNPSTGDVYMPAFMQAGSSTTLDLLKVPLKTGRGKRHERGTQHTIGWLVNQDGTVLAREDLNDAKDVYSIKTKVSGKWETIVQMDDQPLVPFDIIGVMPDKSGLVISRGDERSSAFEKLAWNGTFSSLSMQVANKDIDYIIRDANRVLTGVQYSGVLPSYKFLDAEIDDAVADFTNRFGTASVDLIAHDKTWNRLIYLVFDGATSGVYILHDRTTDQLQSLGTRYNDIPAEAIGDVSAIKYAARDGMQIEAILTWPPAQSNQKNLPLIVMPHGGPSSYDAIGFDWMAQYFANRGYAVLQPNFRGSDGYGEAFRLAGHGQWGTGMQDDVTDGVDTLVDMGIADPSRICIVGANYGGYAALAGGAFTPEKYACVIAIAPATDLRDFIRWVGSRWGKNDSSVDYWKDSIGDPKTERGKLENVSPTNFADAFTAPVLLIHGDDDTIVPITQSFKMNKALKSADKPVKMVKLKGGDHWLAERETRIQTLTEMDAFISEHLK